MSVPTADAATARRDLSQAVRVSVCVPAYNEEAMIAGTVEEAVTTLAELPGEHEILVVDDGSRDETWAILNELRDRFPMLRPLRHAENRGIGEAERTLVQAAAGQYILHIGADRQCRMSELPRMLQVIEEGYDVVIGVRRRKCYTPWRKFISTAFNLTVALLWGKHFGDLGSIKLIRAQLWKQIPFDGTASAFVHAQRLIVAYQNGARIATVPVEHYSRQAGESKFSNPLQAVRAMAELLRFRFSRTSRYRLPANWREAESRQPGRPAGQYINESRSNTMQVPFFDLQSQTKHLKTLILQRLGEVCDGGGFSLGPHVESFEGNFAAYCETQHCVAVNSGTSSLHLALACLDIGPGDEVITVPMTFVATSWAISYVGATPVFVDIDPSTWTLDPELLEAAITPRTKAILPVHLYGRPADMGPIREIADRYGIPVIEDAAQAHGARYRGKRVGGLGRIGCFSFYPSKNLGAFGEGGALVTDDPDVARRARALRNHAQFGVKNQHERLGFNYRMDGFQAAVLDVKLRHLDRWNSLRRKLAGQYTEYLEEIQGLRLPPWSDEIESVFHLFVVALPQRSQVAAELEAAGVNTAVHYPTAVHRQPAYGSLNLPEGSFPEAERLARECLSLPMFPELQEQQVAHVSEQLVRVHLALQAGVPVGTTVAGGKPDSVHLPDAPVAAK